MRGLTLREVNERYEGRLPPDAVLLPDGADAAAEPEASRQPRGAGRGDRFAALNAFVDAGLAGLTAAEVKVWLILFRDTKAATGTARTGQADIARRAGLKVRAVRYALVRLGARGMVTVVRRGRLNAGPSTYRVHPTGAPGGTPTPGVRDGPVTGTATPRRRQPERDQCDAARRLSVAETERASVPT